MNEKHPENVNEAIAAREESAQPPLQGADDPNAPIDFAAATRDRHGGQDPFAVLEKLNAENADLKDRILRTLAEMENLRRRTEKEVADARAYGVTRFAGDMLPLADNLRRAVDSVSGEEKAVEGPLRTLAEGLELTERDFLSRLARHGVKKLEPKGQKFDPNMHEALFELPDPGVPNGTVMQVVEDGYSIGERCLRPAKVGVARGGPKPEQG